MNSNDSLNMDNNHHDGAHADRFNSSAMQSPAVPRRDFAPFALGGPPQPGKMLVDPQTGQQYFVPAAPQPQVAYYPVFYNAAPSQGQFYSPPGYMVQGAVPSPTLPAQPYFYPASFGQSNGFAPTSTTFGQSFAGRPNQQQSQQQQQPYRVEMPPSSSVSVCGERESPTSQFFQRHHESRLSTESTNSSSNSRHFVQNYVDGAKTDDSMSPTPPKQIQHGFVPPVAQAHMEHSARYSTTSSSTTSGFISGAGESPAELHRPKTLRTTFQKPQLYGAPAWWGEDSSPEDKKNEERTPTRHEVNPEPLSQALVESKLDSQSSKPVQKAIRMDIDLSRPFSPEQQKEKASVKPASSIQCTAFTVNFDDHNDKPKKKPPVLSSQEVQQKKLVRRSGPTLPTSNTSHETKHYLFSKMIQGFPEGREDGAVINLSTRKETDTISEAGTYVIENKNTHTPRRNRKFSSSSSSSSASTQTEKSHTASASTTQPSTARTYTPRAESTMTSSCEEPRQSGCSSGRPEKPCQPFAMRRQLMKDLRDLRTQAQQSQQQRQQPADSALSRPGLVPPKVRSMLDPSKSARLAAPHSRQCLQQQQTTSRAGISHPSNVRDTGLRRSDGGRFSMRSGVQQPTVGGMRPATSQNIREKPPFRAGVAPLKKPTKDSPEMVAWLRRKEYDPRKSAAEAKKMQQLKQRLLSLSNGGHVPRRDQIRRDDSDNFFANRSVSYNQPSASGFRRVIRPFGDERSNKSHDDLSHVGEEPDDFSLCGSTSNLCRTVDDLTQKCQKSMQLLKLCNPHAMSPSVEQLLDEMVEERGSLDDVLAVDRLERLSHAFGAIQRCLEMQSEAGTAASSGSLSPARAFTEELRQRLTSPTQSQPSDPAPSDCSPTNIDRI